MIIIRPSILLYLLMNELCQETNLVYSISADWLSCFITLCRASLLFPVAHEKGYSVAPSLFGYIHSGSAD